MRSARLNVCTERVRAAANGTERWHGLTHLPNTPPPAPDSIGCNWLPSANTLALAGKYPHVAAALTRPSMLGACSGTASTSSSTVLERGAAQLSCEGISGIFGSSGRCDMAALTRTCVTGLHVRASLRRDSRLSSLAPSSVPALSSVSCPPPSPPVPRALLQDTESRNRAAMPLLSPPAVAAAALAVLHEAAAFKRAT